MAATQLMFSMCRIAALVCCDLHHSAVTLPEFRHVPHTLIGRIKYSMNENHRKKAISPECLVEYTRSFLAFATDVWRWADALE